MINNCDECGRSVTHYRLCDDCYEEEREAYEDAAALLYEQHQEYERMTR